MKLTEVKPLIKPAPKPKARVTRSSRNSKRYLIDCQTPQKFEDLKCLAILVKAFERSHFL